MVTDGHHPGRAKWPIHQVCKYKPLLLKLLLAVAPTKTIRGVASPPMPSLCAGEVFWTTSWMQFCPHDCGRIQITKRKRLRRNTTRWDPVAEHRSGGLRGKNARAPTPRQDGGMVGGGLIPWTSIRRNRTDTRPARARTLVVQR